MAGNLKWTWRRYAKTSAEELHERLLYEAERVPVSAADSKRYNAQLYRARHRDNWREWKRAYRLRSRGAEGSHTIREWRDLCEFFKHCCAMCGECKPLTRDHIVALSRGGSDYIENIQPLCLRCNSKKGNR